MSTTPTQPAPKPLHKNEQLKAESRALRGHVRAELEDASSGTVTEDSNNLMKFHGIYGQDDRDLRNQRRKEGKEKAYIFMARVRVPGGVVTPYQWQALDTLADSHGNGTLKITNRQSFQFHGVIKSKLRATVQEINRVLLNTIAACGDINRNVMCNPDPENAPLHARVQALARGVSDHLLPKSRAYHEIFLEDQLVAGGEPEAEPIYGRTYLPRKFKVVFAVPPRNDVDVWAHDLGFIAITDERGQLTGFNVTVGGGMGMSHGQIETYPRVADVMGYCTPEQVIAVAEAVVLVQRDFGDRVDRKHARLKYTIADHGLVWFRDQVESRLGWRLGTPRRFEFTHTADRFGWIPGVNGQLNYNLFIENGRVLDTADYPMKTGLREIARIHRGEYRLTPNQHLIIANVAPEDKPVIDALLARYQLDTANHASTLRLHAMACVALPTCGLALAESERYLPEFITALEGEVEAAGLRNDAIVIRMTGCPNGCGRPFLAEIAMVGKAPGKYNVYLGAAFNGSRLNSLYKTSVQSAELVPLLRPLLRQYATDRLPGEHFGDFVIRAGIVKPTHTPQDFHEIKPAPAPKPVDTVTAVVAV
ncbi:MAG TPA: NADPH-dependent assimilatory sulfite reductase hemoprotein subunit [Opitutaceae bacterium]|jgi:sulfite reductase (NADPH) hemoprotein beta-component